MYMTRVTTRRSALGLSIFGFLALVSVFGFLALVSGCDRGVPPSTIESITDQAPGKAEAEARKRAFGTTGQPKTEMPKSP
jgi:hypothetical protein